jgi:ubiquinone/menaquinone biosynthesis C-methylase UbiE
MTKAYHADRVLEVAAGTGHAARMFTTSLMKKGASLVATDISSKMVNLFEQRFKESDVSLIPHVNLKVLETWENVENNPDAKNLYIIKANNESLPFEDSYFDSYISNLSLQIVDNHKNQLSEACRVLKPGCFAGFSVWGRKENSRYFTFLDTIFSKYCLSEDPVTSGLSNFHLNNMSSLKSDILGAGFRSVKWFYTSCHSAFLSDEETLSIIKEQFGEKINRMKVKKEEVDELWERVRQEYYDRFAEDKDEFIDFEALIAIANK